MITVRFALITLLNLVFAAFALNAFCQVDTLSVKNNNLRVANLAEGKSQYLSWMKHAKSGQVSDISLSEREISFRRMKGKDVVVISKHLLTNDTTANRYVSVVSDHSDFRTLYDFSQKGDIIEAYKFMGVEVQGNDTVKHNSKSAFYKKFSAIPYCNEIDLETISAVLVRKIGQKMVISFYQPGSAKFSGFHLLEVTATEKLHGLNDLTIDCWVLRLTFDSEWYDLFWVSKNTHELVRFESWDKEGCYSKVKLFAHGQHF